MEKFLTHVIKSKLHNTHSTISFTFKNPPKALLSNLCLSSDKGLKRFTKLVAVVSLWQRVWGLEVEGNQWGLLLYGTVCFSFHENVFRYDFHNLIFKILFYYYYFMYPAINHTWSWYTIYTMLLNSIWFEDGKRYSMQRETKGKLR